MPRGVYQRTPETLEKLRQNGLRGVAVKKQHTQQDEQDPIQRYIKRVYGIENPDQNMLKQIRAFRRYAGGLKS